MGLDELRSRLDRLLAGLERPTDRRAQASDLHAALVEFKLALGLSKDALGPAQRELEQEQRHFADAERRGRLAAEIGDAETARIAGEFAARHGERVGLLERKVAVVRDEIAYLEREYEVLAGRFQATRQGVGPVPNAAAAAEQAVAAQLELLKKKLGKQ